MTITNAIYVFANIYYCRTYRSVYFLSILFTRRWYIIFEKKIPKWRGTCQVEKSGTSIFTIGTAMGQNRIFIDHARGFAPELIQTTFPIARPRRAFLPAFSVLAVSPSGTSIAVATSTNPQGLSGIRALRICGAPRRSGTRSCKVRRMQ